MKLFTRRSPLRLLIPFAIVASAAAAIPAAAVNAASTQITIWNHTGTATATRYWQPTLTQPDNYVAPINFAGGKAFIKIVVLSKPSTKSMKAQVCFWRHDQTTFQYETCTAAVTFTTPGTYYAELGTPTTWWKKGGIYDWTKQASIGRIMLIDPVTRKLFMNTRCGKHCYTGSDLAQHVPVKMNSRLEFVAQDATFVPPTGW